MKTKEFTNPNDLVEWLAGSYLSEWMTALETNKELIIDGAREAYEDQEEKEEEEFDPDSVDLLDIVEGTVGDPENNFVMVKPEEVKVLLNGKEIPLHGDNSVFWLSECGLGWIYTCFEYSKEEDEYINDDLGFSISDAVRFYAQGWLSGYAEGWLTGYHATQK